MRANKKASQLKSNTLKTDTLNTDTNPGKCTIMKAYGTSRHPREPKAKRSKSAGEFWTPSSEICENENNDCRQYITNNEYRKYMEEYTIMDKIEWWTILGVANMEHKSTTTNVDNYYEHDDIR